MKTLELHYQMIQFLIISDILQFWLRNIRSHDAFRPIACERKDLMDYSGQYSPSLLYGTRATFVLNFPAFQNKKYTADDRFPENGP